MAYGQLYDLWWNPPEESPDLKEPALASEACCHEQLVYDQTNTAEDLSLGESTVETKAKMAELVPKKDNNGSHSETDSTFCSRLLATEAKLGSCRMLLSEEYAAIQSIQKDITRVQQTLADMICQHQKYNLQQTATKRQDSETELEMQLSSTGQSQK